MSTSECFEKSMEILKKPISLGAPPNCSDSDSYGTNYEIKRALDSSLVDIENKLKALNRDFNEKCNSLDQNSSETLFGPGAEFERFDLESFKNGLPLKYNKTSKNLSRDLDQLFGGRDKIRSLGLDGGTLGGETASTTTKRKYNFGHVNCPSEYEFNTRLVDGGSFYDAVPLPHSAKTLRGSCELYGSGAEMRQRSLSFTEKTGSNVDALLRQSMSVLKQQPHTTSVTPVSASASISGRQSLTRKSKSFKARTLRRLSYNPSMMLDDSSSSSSGSELEVSALSECDIRTKGNRRRMLLNRRNGGNNTVEKMMYGSNSSIQSAPHFNYDSMSLLLRNARRNPGLEGNGPVVSQQLSDPYNINYQGGGRSYGGIKSVFSFDRLGQQDSESPSFKWPEKIHGSMVKQNDMFWNKCREIKQLQAPPRYMDSSSSSSGNTVNLPSSGLGRVYQGNGGSAGKKAARE